MSGVDIPSPLVRRVSLTIKGISPLICHRFGESAIAAIEDKQQQKARAKRGAKNPQEEYEECFYYDRNGKHSFPASGIKKSLISAAHTFCDLQKNHVRGAVQVVGDMLRINGSPPVMRKDVVRLGRSGSADMRYRPMFEQWDIEVEFLINERIITTPELVNLTETAGFHVGIGDWRPETSGGEFGMFCVARG